VVAVSVTDLVSYALAHPVGRKTPVRTLSRILNWQIKSRLSAGPFVEPWIGDSKLVVSRGMTGATGNLYFGLHEFSDMGFLLHFLRPDDLFLDIGANVGTYTVLSAKVCQANCWSFEPSAPTLACLRENIAVNGIADRVTVHDFALGAENGEVHFTRELGAMNKVVDGPDAGTESVAIKRLDDVIAGASPIMMKIDVEGHEPALFAGAAKTLAHPSLLALEIETVEGAMAQQLSDAGFVQRYYDPFSRALTDNADNAHGNNMLFIRNEDFVKERLASAPQHRFLGITL
jgi:FkbM family methyltransferase